MNKRPKYKIAFDNSNPTYEETKKGFLDLLKILQRIELRTIQESKDIINDEKGEIISRILSDQKDGLELVDEFFDTLFPKVAEKYNRKKPKKKDK